MSGEQPARPASSAVAVMSETACFISSSLPRSACGLRPLRRDPGSGRCERSHPSRGCRSRPGRDDQVVQRHDARQAGDVGGEGADVVVATAHSNGDRQLGVVFLRLGLARDELLYDEAAAKARLVDVGQQRVHLGLAGQLLLELRDVALDLFLLPLQRLEVDGLRELRAVLFLQRGLLVAHGLQRVGLAADPYEPAPHDHEHRDERPHGQARQQGPLPRLVRVEAAELVQSAAQRPQDIDALGLFALRHLFAVAMVTRLPPPAAMAASAERSAAGPGAGGGTGCRTRSGRTLEGHASSQNRTFVADPSSRRPRPSSRS